MSSIKAIMTLALITIVSLAFIGCSDDNSTVTQAAIDTAPPAVPANLILGTNGDQYSLSWAANTTDADFANFVVKRDYYGQIATLQTSSDNSFLASPLPGLNVFHVSSVDLAGNESAVVSVECYYANSNSNDPELEIKF